MVKTQQISLRKGKHVFVFRFDTGNEPEVLESIVAKARDKDSGSDWFDAAVLSHQICGILAQQMIAAGFPHITP
jgi:hypothetical protein